MMKLVSMLLTLCMVFCMLTVPAAADDLPVVKLDVGTTETYDDTNYKVDANTIILRAEDRVYELTGPGLPTERFWFRALVHLLSLRRTIFVLTMRPSMVV